MIPKVMDTLNPDEKVRYQQTMELLDSEKTLFGVLFYLAKARWILFKARRRYVKHQGEQFIN